MNREDIIRMAREAGGYRAAPTDKALLLLSESQLGHFAALVAAAEREECAKVLDANAEACVTGGIVLDVLLSNAAAIRARGQ